MKPNTLKTTSSCIAGFALALAFFSGPMRAQERPSSPARYTVIDLGPVGPPPGQPFVLTTDDFVSGEVVVTGGGAAGQRYTAGAPPGEWTPVRSPAVAACRTLSSGKGVR
jgi:hypothetical protein